MNRKNRIACLSDLKLYFKKSDLLGGLTELEKRELRKNIGVSTEGEGHEKAVELTYEALWDLISTNSIIIGTNYVITNFKTIYSSNVTNSNKQRISWGVDSKNERLLVRGISSNRLDKRAYLEGKDWEIEYDVTKEILEDGTSTRGKITWLKDSSGNSAYYDFKNIKFRRSREELRNTTENIQAPYLDLYTFSKINRDGTTVEDASEFTTTEYNELKINCWDNVFIGDTYNNIIEAESIGNTFIRGCNNSHLYWNTSYNLFHEPVSYTTGAIHNKEFKIGDTTLSTPLSKTINKVTYDSAVSYIVTFLDPITYSHQVKKIK